MSKVFFGQLGLKKPDVTLDVKGKSPSDQIGTIIIKLGELLTEWKPDMVIVVGDVNSTLAGAIAANKHNIRLAHLESGLRSHDREMPEEINRILTDAVTNDFFITEQSGLDNLKKEINRKASFHFVGNTMIDTLVAFEDQIAKSDVLKRLNIGTKPYALMTMHRPRNVDTKEKLLKLIEIVNSITKSYVLVFPIHPRTKNSLENHGLTKEIEKNDRIVLAPPLGYLDFQRLIASSKIVITDSGGIQEETTYRRIPCLTLRENTERPSTVIVGTNELVPFEPQVIGEKIEEIRTGQFKKGEIPSLWDGKSTQRIVEILYKEFE
jgi:UDP-N-acetylglucosamine 2-epimerase (non-hydrolysing)